LIRAGFNWCRIWCNKCCSNKPITKHTASRINSAASFALRPGIIVCPAFPLVHECTRKALHAA
jgi:hypothetical protein